MLAACLSLVLLAPEYAARAQSRPIAAQTLDMQLSAHSLTFADIDPHSASDIPAQENPVSAFVSYSGPGTLHIYMLANGSMSSVSGGPAIPASRVYWLASGSGYESGKMSVVQEVEAASGPLSSAPGAGWRFFLKQGAYNSGAYQLSITIVATVQ